MGLTANNFIRQYVLTNYNQAAAGLVTILSDPELLSYYHREFPQWISQLIPLTQDNRAGRVNVTIFAVGLGLDPSFCAKLCASAELGDIEAAIVAGFANQLSAAWGAEFCDAVLSPELTGHLDGLISPLLTPIIVGHGLPLPTQPAYIRCWAQNFGLRKSGRPLFAEHLLSTCRLKNTLRLLNPDQVVGLDSEELRMRFLSMAGQNEINGSEFLRPLCSVILRHDDDVSQRTAVFFFDLLGLESADFLNYWETSIESIMVGVPEAATYIFSSITQLPLGESPAVELVTACLRRQDTAVHDLLFDYLHQHKHLAAPPEIRQQLFRLRPDDRVLFALGQAEPRHSNVPLADGGHGATSSPATNADDDRQWPPFDLPQPPADPPQTPSA